MLWSLTSTRASFLRLRVWVIVGRPTLGDCPRLFQGDLEERE
jgi:hypothetical protein